MISTTATVLILCATCAPVTVHTITPAAAHQEAKRPAAPPARLPPTISLPYIDRELQYLPVLRAEIEANWKDVTLRANLAAQVRQETCPSFKSRQCWSPHAELKTDREYGFGLGQITITSKFDNFKEAKKLHSTMADWQWENRYNASYQLRTMVLMDKFNYGKFNWAKDQYERMAFSFAAYNGGIGGILSDKRVCGADAACDGTRWFGHVERTSKKAKVAASGYGKSFFEINREYVRHILIEYPTRYHHYFGEKP